MAGIDSDYHNKSESIPLTASWVLAASVTQPALIPQALLAAAADRAAQGAVFPDYLRRTAENTRRRQSAELACFEGFLARIYRQAGIDATVSGLQHDAEAWRAITPGLVAAWREWLLDQGYAVATVNLRLSTVKTYARLAARAGTLDPAQVAMIREIRGFSHREYERVDADRADQGQQTRVGAKKAAPVSLSPAQARALKAQPDTPQGRRDQVLVCLLLDHGLRCGELAILEAQNVDLKAGQLLFDRPKVHKKQKHLLSRDTLAALKVYLAHDQRSRSGALILGSRRGGALGGTMGERAITARVELLGERVGVVGLSAHDGRHYWATKAARNKTPLDRLQDAGGWSSLAMPLRYIEASEVSNQGVLLDEE